MSFASDLCLVNLSLGGPGPYPDDIQSIAAQRVSAAGGSSCFFKIHSITKTYSLVYVVISAGNSGSGGLQTTGSPSNSLEVMSIGSIDNQYQLTLTKSIIIAPNGKNIVYTLGYPFGGWKTTVNLTIVINSSFRTVILYFDLYK